MDRPSSPGVEAQTDEELQDYIRKTHNTVYHPVGTVRMGQRTTTGCRRSTPS